uniref:Uncharacterized protein n=1 Tax=Hyaloperonospora arabidopsidis (strain Emoy2) TaxID=559515 RepID=M4BXK0_HYAAE
MSLVISQFPLYGCARPPPCRGNRGGDFCRGRAALPATSCGRGRHRRDVHASLYRRPRPAAASCLVVG